jgi:hypothetical protein
MSIERYEVKLPSQRIAAIDLADTTDQVARLAVIGGALRKLGASPITKRTFVLPAPDRCSTADLQGILGELFRAGDRMLVFASTMREMTATALICANTHEGVTVRKSVTATEDDQGDASSHYNCSPSSVFARAAIDNE